VIAVIPALLLGIGISSLVGILAMLYTVGILLSLKLIIEPRFFPRHKYSSLLIVLFVIALAQAFGFMGVVLAPPLAVAVQILFQHLYPFATPTVPPEISEQTTSIKERLLQLRRRVQTSNRREAVRLVARLQRLINRTTDYLQEY
jgi:predicted PurR-regulated permease PerM